MPSTKTFKQSKQALQIAERIKPLLAGLSAEVQGAALADLLSLFLAGHLADTPEATRRLRDEILELHIQAVRNLLPANEKMILARLKRQS